VQAHQLVPGHHAFGVSATKAKEAAFVQRSSTHRRFGRLVPLNRHVAFRGELFETAPLLNGLADAQLEAFKQLWDALRLYLKPMPFS
jgi:hypothetical protein